DRISTAMRSAARRLGSTTRIPGFRPGKVPYEVLLGRFGEEAVFEEALDALGQEVYRQALEDSKLDPIAPGVLNEVVSRDPLVLRYRVPLPPEIELGKYRKLRLDFKPGEATDEALEEVLENLRQRRALIEPANRPARMGDVLVLDVKGELEQTEDPKERRLLEEQGVSLLLDAENDWPVPGIAEQLVGLAAGEQRSLSHTFAEDYVNETLRGKAAQFHFSCKEVKSRLVPDWTDDLARGMGDYEGLLDLRLKVRESLKEQAQQEAKEQYADQAKITYPPVLLDQEIHELIEDLERNLRGQKLTLEAYMQAEGKTHEQLHEDFKPRAEKRLRRALVIGKLIEAEDLQVEDQEVQDRIDRLIGSIEDKSGSLRTALEKPASRHRIGNDVLVEKAVERLSAIARGEKIPEAQPKVETKE
ncbi:MAG TPA: trigger factor, partial [Anaerolineales bacterium]|nr:trigger factor [Anaerolineales bacterium]